MTTVDRHYNVLSRVYDFGFNLGSLWLMRGYQRRAVRALGLREGDTVLDLGCGTGLLFEDLVAAVGERGRVVGLDMSPGMLHLAHNRIRKWGWKNVEVRLADLTKENLSVHADAAIFSLVLSLIPAYEAVLRESVKLVKPGGPVVVADSWKNRGRWYHPLANAFIHFKAPFVYSDPNNRIKDILPRYLVDVSVSEELMGVYSIAKGFRKKD
jgi:ubiquinone/menaquinone biosynthesis C-methylase UbiE